MKSKNSSPTLKNGEEKKTKRRNEEELDEESSLPRKTSKRNILTLGDVSESSKVPAPTTLHKKLVEKSKNVKKEVDGNKSGDFVNAEEDRPMTVTRAKKEYKTHFDEIYAQLQKLTI